MNQLSMVGIPMVLMMGSVLFFGYRIAIVGVVLWVNSLIFLFTLWLNYKGKTTLSRFIISTIPALALTFFSAFAKSRGNSDTLIFYLNPRIGVMIIYSLSLFLFGFEKYAKLFWGISIPLLCFIFFDFIHQSFSVSYAELPYLPSEYPSFLTITSVLLIFISFGTLFIQQINTAYERKVQAQKKEIEQQRDKLIAFNEEINQQKEEIEAQRDLQIVMNQEIQLQKHELEDLYADVRASITYAQRIQKAILPPLEDISNVLPESFVLFMPRDVVSGDFYWFTTVADENANGSESGEKIILVAADCTGHGVPGAFMSMIGNDLLDTIIHDKKIHEADKILNELHKGVRKALKQEDNKMRDGMDIVLVVIDKVQKTMEFAGAKNPLIYLQNGEIFQIKGDKMPIGGEQKEQDRYFTKHTISLSMNEQSPEQSQTTFYLFSDGFQDQFGGQENKKFMVTRFRELLLSIHQEDMAKQKETLQSTIEAWMAAGNEKQIDDILVIGVRI